MRSWLARHPAPGRLWPVLGLLVALLATTTPAAGDPAADDAAPAANNATVFYWTESRDWSAYHLHYAPEGGGWTDPPGLPMEPACAGWVKRTVDLGGASGLTAAFTDGAGTWDNNDGEDYRLGAGPVTVRDGETAVSDPCGPGGDPDPGRNTAEVYYATATLGWRTVNLHYRPDGGAWTSVPGVGMAEACPGWVKRTVDLGGASGLTAAFNNGAGTWDNNNGADYRIGTGLTTVRDRQVVPDATDPCAGREPDTEAPSAPANLTADVDGVGVLLRWDAARDDVGVTGYRVTVAGGPPGTVVVDTASTVWSATDLRPRTRYTFTVLARDAAGNLSEPTPPVAVTTGDAPPAPAPGEPIGTDPRRDPIYFVLTARFNDGDSANNRGGGLHERSGNAAHDDPMFRGDFRGLIDRLDYIKGLGFSAVWITPVVLNRSDYDYHGYHGWDFYRVDPRLESSGATYQDLINAAHAKGMKIYQDVVYNHSSRWGARGLYTPTAYGVRDEQWDWYYDVPEEGRAYDPLEEDERGYPYNGDLWSTEEPAANTCVRWGQPTQWTSPEGYRIYECQWPSPTSGMFPEEFYHQCWIGNWEGEDSRSCWLHDDLADLNTENATVRDYLINAYNRFIDMGVDGFRVDTAVHIPRVMWTRHFLPAMYERVEERFGAEKAANFFVFGEVAAFVNDKWNRGSVNHSAQFFTWQPRRAYSPDDAEAVLEEYAHENGVGPAGQPTSDNAFLDGNEYHAPDRSRFSGMHIIDMRMHMNFGDAANAFHNGRDSDDATNDATYNVVYVDSHDYGPNKSGNRYAGGTDAWAENMSLMWTFRGIPTLYYGSEIEFQAGERIDCGPSCPLATTGRAYFGDHLEGHIQAGDFGEVVAADGPVARTLEHPLVEHVQRLNQIRRAVPALQMGQYSTEGVSGGMAFKRRWTDAGTDSFALVTVSGGARFTGIPDGRWTDVVTGRTVEVTGGTLDIEAPGKGNARVYVLDTGDGTPGRVGAPGPYLR
ncbi:carbohydrate binding domain-containing protein [Streptomyces marincola]|uniref:carbohydrate binding domain-containing protein n=1 Tax=Streptomyces marincola TaxID=2878388 RepID=UPI001CF3D318|nr:carbohydrate binding domain-containing protein [Streptomyces marincola]UCM87022.1 alpha-amylase [Streptomyces marincola]